MKMKKIEVDYDALTQVMGAVVNVNTVPHLLKELAVAYFLPKELKTEPDPISILVEALEKHDVGVEKITNISTKTRSSLSSSPEQILNEALKLLESEGTSFYQCKKMIIIALDDNDGKYDINYKNAGMSCSECIAVVELLKVILKKQMGY